MMEMAPYRIFLTAEKIKCMSLMYNSFFRTNTTIRYIKIKMKDRVEYMQYSRQYYGTEIELRCGILTGKSAEEF